MRVAVGIALIAILFTAVAACGGSSNNSNNAATAPTKIRNRVDSIVNHINSGDAKAILDDDVPTSARRTCSDKDAKDTVNGARQLQAQGGGKLAVKSIDNVQVNGNHATANVLFTTGSDPVPMSFVKDGSTWHVDPSAVPGCNGLIPTGVG